jgi:hypothetical protein
MKESDDFTSDLGNHERNQEVVQLFVSEANFSNLTL